jgi:phosphoenolpyruvate carboxykinase (ATP)
MSLGHTRAMVSATLNGELERARFTAHPIFGVEVPDRCPAVPDEVLDPRSTWDDPDAYDAKARELAGRFEENFVKFDGVPEQIAAAGPEN